MARIQPFQWMQGGSPSGWQANLFWLRLFLLLHVASRTILAHRNPVLGQEPWLAVTYSLLIAVCLVGLVPRLTWIATCLATALLGLQIAGTMPITANHIFLEFLCLGIVALLHKSRDEERELAITALRWLVAIALFYSGLQKLIYGYYFDGQFLAYATATEDRFASFFRFFMPFEEFQRLRALDATELGAGPYRVRSVLFIAISNSAYLFELAIPFLLAIRRTRSFAAIAAVLFVVTIQAGARELMFGALFINLLLLFLPGRWVKLMFPPVALVYLYLAAASFELVPMFRYYH